MNKLWIPAALALVLGTAAGCMHNDKMMDDDTMMKGGMSDTSMMEGGMSDDGMKDEGMMEGDTMEGGM